jgi:hypothetical protein
MYVKSTVLSNLSITLILMHVRIYGKFNQITAYVKITLHEQNHDPGMCFDFIKLSDTKH